MQPSIQLLTEPYRLFYKFINSILGIPIIKLVFCIERWALNSNDGSPAIFKPPVVQNSKSYEGPLSYYIPSYYITRKSYRSKTYPLTSITTKGRSSQEIWEYPLFIKISLPLIIDCHCIKRQRSERH